MSERLNTLIDNKALQVQDNPVLQGNFAPVDIENSFDQLEVIGSIPVRPTKKEERLFLFFNVVLRLRKS